MRQDRAAGLRAFLTTEPPTTRVFDMPEFEGRAELVREDLEAVEILYTNSFGGVADFQSRRVIFSATAAAGVRVKTPKTRLCVQSAMGGRSGPARR